MSQALLMLFAAMNPALLQQLLPPLLLLSW
jgi:hypothetical protein